MSAFSWPHLEEIQNPGSDPVSWSLVQKILSCYWLKWTDNIKYSYQLLWSGVLILDILKLTTFTFTNTVQVLFEGVVYLSDAYMHLSG